MGEFQYLKDLNPAQKEAVLHEAAPLLVFAGAGSGKTRVLTRRIAHLIHSGQARPYQILAVTFTNKASREMKERVVTLLQDLTPDQQSYQDFSRMWVSTFHSACVRILRRHAPTLDYSKNFVIYDRADSTSALKRVCKSLRINPKTINLRQVMQQIDKAKNDYLFSDHFRDSFISSDSEMIADLYDGYQQELHQANAMDFSDLLCNVVTLFTLEPDILAGYRRQFRHILVDEYQDTNTVQYMLIKMLGEGHQSVCVVGDDDQSIYSFRGANIKNIGLFKKDFPELKTVILNINYRSSKTILEAANSVIANNSARQEKAMRTDNLTGDAIVFYSGANERGEARFVASAIDTARKEGASLSEMAVFYRTNAQSRAIEELLCEFGIPYEIYGGHRFYDRKEIKDILAYAKLAVNPSDNESLLRVLNTPTRGIGKTTVELLIRQAATDRCTLYQVIEAIDSPDTKFQLPTAAKKNLLGFLSLLRELKTKAETKIPDDAEEASFAVARFIRAASERSGYIAALEKSKAPEAQSRIENLHELFAVAVEYGRYSIAQGLDPSLQGFLDRACLSSDLEKENRKSSAEDGPEEAPEEKSAERVSLMTLHLAKGLEFDTVFLIGLEEGLLPHSMSLDDSQGLEEERRLCYVGFTRAKKQLNLSIAESRVSFSNSNWFNGQPSRFLSELPYPLLSAAWVEKDVGFG